MKILALLLVVVPLSGVAGFQSIASSRGGRLAVETSTSLWMGWLDNMFKPVHGHPGQFQEQDLDEMYNDQQKVLHDRHAHHLDKPHLKKKYRKQQGSWIESMFQEPIHGAGSADDGELDDMWEAQQELLYKRREYGKNKDQLKKKYWHKKPEVQEKERHQYNAAWEHSHLKGDPKMLNQKEDNAMYVDEESSKSPFTAFRMPWQNKAKLKP